MRSHSAPPLPPMCRLLHGTQATSAADHQATCCIPTLQGYPEQLLCCISALPCAHPKHQLSSVRAIVPTQATGQQDRLVACCIPEIQGFPKQPHCPISALPCARPKHQLLLWFAVSGPLGMHLSKCPLQLAASPQWQALLASCTAASQSPRAHAPSTSFRFDLRALGSRLACCCVRSVSSMLHFHNGRLC